MSRLVGWRYPAQGAAHTVAIYHLSAKVISRTDGRSAVAAAAYRAAEALPDDRLGRTHDFTHKAGVVHSEILLPEGAPACLLDRATLWNAVEAGEKRKDAQPFCASSLWRWTVASRSQRIVAWSSRSRLTGPVPLSPSARLSVSPKERGAAFGPPRDGFGLFPGLFDGGEQRAGEGFERQGIGSGRQHQIAELGSLAVLEGLGFLLECLDLGIEIDGLAHGEAPAAG